MKPQRIREILTSESNTLRRGGEASRKAGYMLLDFVEHATDEELVRMRELLARRDPTPIPMTALQETLWAQIAQYKGKGEIMIATSDHSWVNAGRKPYPETWKPVAFALAATVQGMMMKGRVRIVKVYWRGMTIEVL